MAESVAVRVGVGWAVCVVCAVEVEFDELVVPAVLLFVVEGTV